MSSRMCVRLLQRRAILLSSSSPACIATPSCTSAGIGFVRCLSVASSSSVDVRRHQRQNIGLLQRNMRNSRNVSSLLHWQPRRHLSLQPFHDWLFGGGGGAAVGQLKSPSSLGDCVASSSSVPDLPQNLSLGDLGFIPDAPSLPLPMEGIELLTSSLRDLGLMSYWPSGWVQWIMHLSHTELHLPWIGCIAVAMVVVRTLTVPVNVALRRNQHKLNRLQPKIDELKAVINQAETASSKVAQYEANLAQFELQELLKKENISPMKSVGLTSCTMVVMMTCFFAIRGLCNSGDLIGFDQGGLLWFVDLTGRGDVWYDGWSTYFMPALNSLTVHYTLKTGLEAVTQDNPIMRRAMLYGFPVIAFGIISYQPVAISCYWVMSNFYTILMAYAFRQPRVQDFLGLPPPPTKNAVDSTASTFNPGQQWREFWAQRKSGKGGTAKPRDLQLADRQRFQKAGEYVRAKKIQARKQA